MKSNTIIKSLKLHDNCITNDFLSVVAYYIARNSSDLGSNTLPALQKKKTEFIDIREAEGDTYELLEQAELDIIEHSEAYEEEKRKEQIAYKHAADDLRFDEEVYEELHGTI